FWILKINGQILYSDECFVQGSEEFNSALFAGFISAIQSFIQELGEKNAETIELGSSRIILSKNEDLGLVFVLRSKLGSKEKKIRKMLDKIIKTFVENYSKYINTEDKIRTHIFSSFHKEFHKIIGDNLEKRMKSFFGSL
ncbi:MAG: hypothetical protein ACTSVY_13845, partial [Candidatus Helarchaeota archaeon]